jgi:CheY-like chemotaxis protein
MRPRIFLADDHPAVLKATTALLEPQFDIVGNATDGATLVSEVLRLRPEVIVVDITMPVLSGIDAAHRLRESPRQSKLCSSRPTRNNSLSKHARQRAHWDMSSSPT